MTNLDPAKRRANSPFRVIEGGLTSPVVEPPRYLPSGHRTPAAIEEDHLSKAILRLQVPSIGMTVEAALDEICSVLHVIDLAKVQRGTYLSHEIERIGVRFQMADPGLGLAREGFLLLVWPQRLLAEHPELAHLHPLAHPYMMLG